VNILGMFVQNVAHHKEMNCCIVTMFIIVN